MKKSLHIITAVLLMASVFGSCTGKDKAEVIEQNSEIIEIKSFDGYSFKGRLTMPEGTKDVSKLVIFVNGSGPNTYLNRRTGFDYFDFYAYEFPDRGIAFFSYNTRGAEIGSDPPLYTEINYDEYQSYLPLNTVEDIYHMITALKENERLKDCRVYLLGWSEGAMIAPLAAEKYPDLIDGLFLAGYLNQNMKDVLIWQNTGGPSMVWYRAHFDADEKGRISKAAYEEDPNKVIESILQGEAFEGIDSNNDGFISEEDFAVIWKDIVGYSLGEVLSAVENRDDKWLRENYGGGYLPLTSGWFAQHFSLRSSMEVLPGLDLPIYIFHGTLDQNADVREVYKVNDKFREAGKTNLTINIFDKHNHDLNYEMIIENGEIPEGIMAIFDAVEGMKIQ